MMAAVAAVFDDPEQAAIGGVGAVHRCSAGLGRALAAMLDDCAPMPEVICNSDVHVTFAEHEQRLLEDPLYRFALGKDVLAGNCEVAARGHVAFDPQSRWIYGAGDTPDDALEAAEWASTYLGYQRVDTKPASPRLIQATLEQGLMVPGLWQIDGELAVHESEQPSDPVPVTQLRRVKPPVPAWKCAKP